MLSAIVWPHVNVHYLNGTETRFLLLLLSSLRYYILLSNLLHNLSPLSSVGTAMTLSDFACSKSHSQVPPAATIVPTTALLPRWHQTPLPVACNWLSPYPGKAGGLRQAGGDPFPWGIQQPSNQRFSWAASFTLQLEQLPLWELYQ